MNKEVRFCVVSAFMVSVAFGVTQPSDFILNDNISGDSLTIKMGFDAGGYSDWWDWAPSERHDYFVMHEMLSGEYGAAIYYDGIDTDTIDPNDPFSENEAMWLTDVFSYPTFPTNSKFSKNGDTDCWFSVWNDPNNKPVNGVNTARSIIVNDDGRVRITIDYEIVDLGQEVEEGKDGSPLSFFIRDPEDPNNADKRDYYFVYSERYVLLQTYTITNIDPNETILENIEFYQMIHSHAGDEYYDVTSVYDDTEYWKDPLKEYVPYNSIHRGEGLDTAGDFKFDITQWNGDWDDAEGHIDWISFSSRIEPDTIDNGCFSIPGLGLYADHNVKQKPPRPGTHWNIEDRNLNEKDYCWYEPAGAMGWYFGNLASNESVSHTIAVMFGSGPVKSKPDVEPAFSLSKTDDAGDCASVCNDTITYTIGYRYLYNNPLVPDLTFAHSNAEDVILTDYLPDEVDFLYADPNSGYYDAARHAYVWNAGGMSGGDSGGLDIIVEVNDTVIPGGKIENKLVVEFAYSGIAYSQEIVHTTEICECGDCTDIIYVDSEATSGSNNGTSWANAYLKLEDALANAEMCNQIWVAQGTYVLSADPGDENTFRLKNGIGVYGGFDATETHLHERDWMSNDTVLDGYDDPNKADYVVTADSSTRWALLDGFIIKNGQVAGIFIDNGASVQIEHNRIEGNGAGILSDDGNAPLIRNNFIYDNTVGMYFEDSDGEATVFNNTISENVRGIHAASGTEPNIVNCILWGQTADANDLIDCYASYSCIEYPQYEYDNSDPNNPVIISVIGVGNIDDDPLFETGGYHITANSPCIDTGDPDRAYDFQRDIDKEYRILGGRINIGADEYCDAGDTTDLDFNHDNLVNLEDFVIFSDAWLTKSTEPDYNPDCDIVSDNEINADDFFAFVEDWLWMSCSRMTVTLLEGEQDLGASSMQTLSMSLLMAPMSYESTVFLPVEPVLTQNDLKKQAAALEEVIVTLETIWAEDDIQTVIDRQNWDNFMDTIYKSYNDSLDASDSNTIKREKMK